MEMRFVTQHERLGLCLDGSQPLFAGSHVNGRASAALGWTGKTKGFSERFLVLVALLAVARKLPAEVRQQLSIACDDQGCVALLDLRKLSPFCGPRSFDNIKIDICNHFARAGSERPVFISIQAMGRGNHDKNLLSLTCNPEHIHFESSQQLLGWLQKYIQRPEHAPTATTAPSTRTPDRGPPQPSWQFQLVAEEKARADRPTAGEAAFSPRRPIENPRLFFGRSRELRTLLGWLSRRPMHNAAILGSRLAGKTSLLRQICHLRGGALLRPEQRAELPSVLPRPKLVYVDFEISHMLKQTRLLNYILNALDLSTHESTGLDDFFEIMSASIQQPTVIMFDNLGASMRENADKKDEDALANVFWDCMRALVSNYTDGNLAFMVSAHETPEKLAGRYHYSSSFFNIFRPVWLGPLSTEAAEALVDSSPLPFSPQDRSFILELCGGWPSLLQIACAHCLEAMSAPADSLPWRQAAQDEVERTRGKATEGS